MRRIFICKDLNEFFQCQKYLFSEGCHWNHVGYKIYDPRENGMEINPTFQLYDNEGSLGWDHDGCITSVLGCNNDVIINFSEFIRPKKLKRILSEPKGTN